MYIESNVVKEPELYDLFNSKCIGDIAMYCKMFENTETVLELGVGTGRIAIPLAEAGIKVIGVNVSNDMIQRLVQKLPSAQSLSAENISLIEQNFCNLSLDTQVSAAFYPFCTFNYILNHEQQMQALLSLRKHLNKSANVIFDLMTIHTFPKILYNNYSTHFDSVCIDRFDVSIETTGSFDQSTQLFTQNRVFKYFRNNDKISEKRVQMVNRIFMKGEFELLLDKCGYSIKSVYGDYRYGSFNCNSPNLVIIAEPKI